jgi:hypothetical protein
MKAKIARMPVRSRPTDPAQPELELHVECEVERDGIGMGVLNDGTPFLNQRGIGDLCGLRNKYIGIISAEWSSANPPPEVRRVKELLLDQGVVVPEAPHIEVWVGKRRYLAYPDTVCMAMLEYFAFDAGRAGAEVALRNYRRLARFGLKQFIYAETGYVSKAEDDVWKIFRDRVSLTFDAVPAWYFGVFKEMASVIVTLGLAGLHIDEKFVPDISVGQAWSKHWERSGLANVHGHRATYLHNYPAYFPQAASNPQLASCYPEAALGEFRRWFREDYIGMGRFKQYLTKKADELLVTQAYVERAVLALTKE